MIRVLYFAGCPHWRAALDIARDVGGRMGAPVEAVEVTDIAQARALGFRGSPTVQIDGRDVERGIIDAPVTELACRIYRVAGRLTPVPPAEWIERAIREARE